MKSGQLLCVLLCTTVLTQAKDISSAISLKILSSSGNLSLCHEPVPPRGSTMMDFIDTCQPKGGSYPAYSTTCQCKRCELELVLSCIDNVWYSSNPTICNNLQERCGSCSKVHKATDVTCDSEDRKAGYSKEVRVCSCVNTLQNVTVKCSRAGWKITDHQAYREACGDPADYTSATELPEVVTVLSEEITESLEIITEIVDDAMESETSGPTILQEESTTSPEMSTTSPEVQSENHQDEAESTENALETTTVENEMSTLPVSSSSIGVDINTEKSLEVALENSEPATRCYKPLYLNTKLVSKLSSCSSDTEFPSHETTCDCEDSDLKLQLKCFDFQWLYDHSQSVCE